MAFPRPAFPTGGIQGFQGGAGKGPRGSGRRMARRIASPAGGQTVVIQGTWPPSKPAETFTGGAAESDTVDVQVSAATLQSIASLGRPLDSRLRATMEQIFRASFAEVRVVTHSVVRDLGAHAITYGGVIYFAPGRYEARTPAGRALLARELTHVLQQRTGRVQPEAPQGLVIVVDPSLEAQATMMGLAAATSEQVLRALR